MKTKNLKSIALGLLAVIFFQSCSEEPLLVKNESETIIPEQFRVEIPSSLSDDNVLKSSLKSTSAEYDTLSGKDIYGHLRHFIRIGDNSAELIEQMLMSIAVHKINRPITMSYVSDDDGKLKNLVVTTDEYYEGIPWQYKLVITDAESEGNPDKGKAIELFWNRDPVKGIATLKPFNINKNETRNPETIFRVDYGETSEYGYDRWMIVSVSGLPLERPAVDPYSIDNLKMFVGRTGDIVDVYGNSNHPNATFFAPAVKGFNWAFVASSNRMLDIGVAEIGLPYSYINASTADVILKEYSIKNVFEREIKAQWGDWISQEAIDAYLANTEAPGYFDQFGFVAAGTAPSDDYTEIERSISNLVPYSPKAIAELELSFSE